MRKIVILGNSVATIKCIETIQSQSDKSEFVIFPINGERACDPCQYNKILETDEPAEEIFYKPQSFYESPEITVNTNKVSRINLRRKRIYTEEKEQISFDYAIITDTVDQKFPDIKGTKKEHVYSLNSVNDLNQIITRLPFSETITIEATTANGLLAAVTLGQKGKHIDLIVSSNLLISAEDEDSGLRDILCGHFADNNIRLFFDNHISEILGDTEVKAVRLDSGKVLESHLVLFDQTYFDFRGLEDAGLEINRGIKVNANYQTNYPYVYAADKIINQSEKDAESRQRQVICALEKQGQMIANAILEREEIVHGAEEISYQSAGNEDFNLEIIGDLITNDCTIQSGFNQNFKRYVRLYLKNNELTGAMLINGKELTEKIKNALCGDGVQSDVLAMVRDLNENSELSQPEVDATIATDHLTDETEVAVAHVDSKISLGNQNDPSINENSVGLSE